MKWDAIKAAVEAQDVDAFASALADCGYTLGLSLDAADADPMEGGSAEGEVVLDVPGEDTSDADDLGDEAEDLATDETPDLAAESVGELPRDDTDEIEGDEEAEEAADPGEDDHLLAAVREIRGKKKPKPF